MNQSHQHLAIPSSHDDNHNNTEITLIFFPYNWTDLISYGKGRAPQKPFTLNMGNDCHLQPSACYWNQQLQPLWVTGEPGNLFYRSLVPKI